MQPLRMWFFRVGLAVLAVSFLTGAGNKAKGYLLTVHVEAPAEDSPKFASPVKLGSESRQYYFRKIPEFKDDDIAWYYPFTSRDGNSFGVAFKLKSHQAAALKALTLTHQGKLLGLRIPSAPYKAVLIDRPIDDGIIVYWDGLSKQHLQAFGKKFPHADAVRQARGGTPDPTAVSLPPTAGPR